MMSFDESVITSIAPPLFQSGHLILSWTSTAAAGTWYQVYVQGVLSDATQALTSTIAAPAGTVEVRIGSVTSGEQHTDFSSSFVTLANKATLSWSGGAFEGSNLMGFHVYGSSVPGGPVDYTRLLATIVAFEQGDTSEGYSLGGYSGGGYGDANPFTWTSGPLDGGTWTFAVVPYSEAGNEGVGAAATVNIIAPPKPPARNAQGQRLTYTYSPSARTVTLSWLASG